MMADYADYPSPTLEAEMAQTFPGCNPLSVAQEVEEIMYRLVAAQFHDHTTSSGSRKILNELRALMKALDGLGPYAHIALRRELRSAWKEGYPWLNGEVHLDVPEDLPIGWMTLSAMKFAICAVANNLETSKPGPKDHISVAAVDLVNLYCRHANVPTPCFDRRDGVVRHHEPLEFAHLHLVRWCGLDKVPAAADLVWPVEKARSRAAK